MATEISSLSFSALEIAEHLAKRRGHFGDNGVTGLGFHVSMTPEFEAAVLASCKAIVGDGFGDGENNRISSANLAPEVDVDSLI